MPSHSRFFSTSGVKSFLSSVYRRKGVLLGISPDELKDVRVPETYVGDERIFTLAGQ